VADRSTQLLLQALSRAAAESSAVPLFAGRGGPGLFPSTAAGKQAAQRCRDEGYLLDAGAPGSVTLSDEGRKYLLGQLSPREVLEDFVRVLEAREGQVAHLVAQVRQLQTSLEATRQQVAPVLDQVRRQESGSLNGLFEGFHEAGPDDLAGRIVEALGRWANLEDCPLPELFRRCGAATIGAFHDALRRLSADGRLHLQPWTGPLYAIPEPPYALLVGHEVAYFASSKQGGS
jgi:hypothetical protein